jgi:hypothetical protein
MSAIQEIQTLISQGQPIPESVQLNALREASSLGLSNAELGATLGVPESMISDAAANLGFGQMGIRPPAIPAPNPVIQNINNQSAKAAIQGIPVTGTYTPEQVQTVTDLINTGQVNISDVS